MQAAQAQPRLFLAHLLLMQVVAEEAPEFRSLLLVVQAVRVAQVAVVMAVTHLAPKTELLTQAVALAVDQSPVNPAGLEL